MNRDPVFDALGWILWAVLLISFFVLLAGCAAKPTKPDIPDDLIPVCHEGQIGVLSEKAQQVLTWPIACDRGSPV